MALARPTLLPGSKELLLREQPASPLRNSRRGNGMYARIALLAACAGLAGCVVERTGPTEHVMRTIERGEAKSLRVNLRMGAGDLRVSGGSSDLAEADCTYNVPS